MGSRWSEVYAARPWSAPFGSPPARPALLPAKRSNPLAPTNNSGIWFLAPSLKRGSGAASLLGVDADPPGSAPAMSPPARAVSLPAKRSLGCVATLSHAGPRLTLSPRPTLWQPVSPSVPGAEAGPSISAERLPDFLGPQEDGFRLPLRPGSQEQRVDQRLLPLPVTDYQDMKSRPRGPV